MATIAKGNLVELLYGPYNDYSSFTKYSPHPGNYIKWPFEVLRNSFEKLKQASILGVVLVSTG